VELVLLALQPELVAVRAALEQLAQPDVLELLGAPLVNVCVKPPQCSQ